MTKTVRLAQDAVRAAAICTLTGLMMATTTIVQAQTDSAAQADRAPLVDATYPHPQPPYPDSAQVSGEQGNVVLDVRVLANGHVRNVTVDQSSGFADLDNAAVEGVMRWHFLPALRDGDTTTEWTKVTIVYQLPMPAPPAQPSPPGPKSSSPSR